MRVNWLTSFCGVGEKIKETQMVLYNTQGSCLITFPHQTQPRERIGCVYHIHLNTQLWFVSSFEPGESIFTHTLQDLGESRFTATKRKSLVFLITRSASSSSSSCTKTSSSLDPIVLQYILWSKKEIDYYYNFFFCNLENSYISLRITTCTAYSSSDQWRRRAKPGHPWPTPRSWLCLPVACHTRHCQNSNSSHITW